jgi:hypothetical protein
MVERVGETLGPCQKEPPPAGLPRGLPLAVFTPSHNIPDIHSPLWEILAQRLDKHLAWPTKKSLLNRFKSTGKQHQHPTYTRDEYVCIMAFCNVHWAWDIPKPWRHFTSTKAKQIEIHRWVIQSSMSKWAYNHCTKIDTIFFEQKMIEDIINLWFNPSNGVATYWMAKCSILILVCCSRGIAETKQIGDQEHTAEVTKGTQFLDEANQAYQNK